MLVAESQHHASRQFPEIRTFIQRFRHSWHERERNLQSLEPVRVRAVPPRSSPFECAEDGGQERLSPLLRPVINIPADCLTVRCCCLDALAATKGATRKLMKPCCEPGRFTWSLSSCAFGTNTHYYAPSPCRLTSQLGFPACFPANSAKQIQTAVIAILLVALLEELVQDAPSPSTANVERLPRKSQTKPDSTG